MDQRISNIFKCIEKSIKPFQVLLCSIQSYRKSVVPRTRLNAFSANVIVVMPYFANNLLIIFTSGQFMVVVHIYPRYSNLAIETGERDRMQ